MPFCPNCGTEMTEDTRYCPECGRPFMIVGKAGNGKDKKKIAGIIAACIIVIIVIVVVATRPPTSMEPEPAIPTHFTTYTDALGRFSISYPPEWELGLEYLEDVSVETAQFLFMAGLPTIEDYYAASVNILTGPCPGIICTHDSIVRAEIEAMKSTSPVCRVLSQVKTTVDGRTATIVVAEETGSYVPEYNYVQMFLLVDRTEWCVTCATLTDDYGRWEDDFDAIVRSLRILE